MEGGSRCRCRPSVELGLHLLLEAIFSIAVKHDIVFPVQHTSTHHVTVWYCDVILETEVNRENGTYISKTTSNADTPADL